MGLISDKLWSILGLGIGSLCLLLHVIAFSLPNWVSVKRGKDAEFAGLWQSCFIVADVKVGCRTIPIIGEGVDDALQPVRAFACIALVLLLQAVVVSILNIIKSENKMLSAILIAIHVAACLCLIIAFSVFSAKNLKDHKEFKAGASFGLEIVCFILELVAAVFMFLDFKGRRE